MKLELTIKIKDIKDLEDTLILLDRLRDTHLHTAVIRIEVGE